MDIQRHNIAIQINYTFSCPFSGHEKSLRDLHTDSLCLKKGAIKKGYKSQKFH